jgi:predicted metal-dependent peptidase
MSQYEDYAIDIWCFDTDIYNHQRFTHDDGDALLEYQPQGGGGTDFEANFEYMKSIDLVPKKFIMFTDGYPCGSWGDEDYCDSLFIVKGSNNESPFGQTVLYDEATA